MTRAAFIVNLPGGGLEIFLLNTLFMRIYLYTSELTDWYIGNHDLKERVVYMIIYILKRIVKMAKCHTNK